MTDRYEVVASAGGQSNTAEKRLMLQKLLADRFGLVFHAETREVGGYALDHCQGGPKLQPPASDEGGLMLGRTPKGLRNMIGKNQKTSGLIMVLADLLDHPVLDATGLTGSYDFYLEMGARSGRISPQPSQRLLRRLRTPARWSVHLHRGAGAARA